jgi:hypothetical protein
MLNGEDFRKFKLTKEYSQFTHMMLAYLRFCLYDGDKIWLVNQVQKA